MSFTPFGGGNKSSRTSASKSDTVSSNNQGNAAPVINITDSRQVSGKKIHTGASTYNVTNHLISTDYGAVAAGIQAANSATENALGFADEALGKTAGLLEKGLGIVASTIDDTLSSNQQLHDKYQQAHTKALESINTNVNTAFDFARDAQKGDAGQSEALLKIILYGAGGIVLLLMAPKIAGALK